jgi:hypothetical protein
MVTDDITHLQLTQQQLRRKIILYVLKWKNKSNQQQKNQPSVLFASLPISGHRTAGKSLEASQKEVLPWQKERTRWQSSALLLTYFGVKADPCRCGSHLTKGKHHDKLWDPTLPNAELTSPHLATSVILECEWLPNPNCFSKKILNLIQHHPGSSV